MISQRIRPYSIQRISLVLYLESPDLLRNEEPIDIYYYYFFLIIPIQLQIFNYNDVTYSYITHYLLFQSKFLDKKIPLFAFEDFLNEDRFKETLVENVAHTYFVELTILKKSNKYYPMLWSLE